MQDALAKKTAIVALSLILGAQPALASLSESTFWKQRRANLDHTPQLPDLKTALLDNTDSPKKQSLNLPKRLKSLIDAVPLGVATVREVYDSGDEKAPVVL